MTTEVFRGSRFILVLSDILDSIKTGKELGALTRSQLIRVQLIRHGDLVLVEAQLEDTMSETYASSGIRLSVVLAGAIDEENSQMVAYSAWMLAACEGVLVAFGAEGNPFVLGYVVRDRRTELKASVFACIWNHGKGDKEQHPHFLSNVDLQ